MCFSSVPLSFENIHSVYMCDGSLAYLEVRPQI